jgi:ABC-type sugar transport system substrate-binding protein
MTDKMESLTYSAIQSYGKPDLVISCTGDATLGIVEALKKAYVYAPRGEEGHIPVVGWDASRTMLSLIREGSADLGIDQGNYFYCPMAIYYAKRIIELGKDAALPKTGTTLTHIDVDIAALGKEHLGLNPWLTPEAWEPGKVVIGFGHPTIECAGMLFDSTNVNDPALWGNLREIQMNATG